MKHLTQPTLELAENIINEVSFEKRFRGACLHGRTGIKPLQIYSITELLVLLNMPHPLIDTDDLSKWIETVIRDRDLAEQIRSASSIPNADQKTIIKVRDMVGERLVQAKQIKTIQKK